MSHSIVLAFIALAVMAAVRLVVALATREVTFRWLVAAPLWAACVVGAVMATGCVSADDGPEIDAGEEPDAEVPDVDAMEPDAAPDPDAEPTEDPFIEFTQTMGVSGEHSYAQFTFYVNCPEGAPDGPHQGAIEFYSNLGLVETRTFEWTCGFSWQQITWFNLSCGLDVWGRAVAVHPVTGEPAYLVTDPQPTIECEQ